MSRHHNAREQRWTEKRIREVAESTSPNYGANCFNMSRRGNLDRAVNVFLDLRLTDFLYELQTGIGLWSREQTIAVTVNVIRGLAPPPPKLTISSAGALALAQALLTGKFGAQCRTIQNPKSKI